MLLGRAPEWFLAGIAALLNASMWSIILNWLAGPMSPQALGLFGAVVWLGTFAAMPLFGANEEANDGR
jgi:hypothetical protein